MSLYGTRNRLARMVLNKIENDKYLSAIDRTEWYKITDLENIVESKKFIQFDEDQETKNFLKDCIEKSDYFVTQIFHSMIQTLLGWFMATTSVNGLLQRGSMFVFSVQQFRMLIEYDSAFNGMQLENLLDLGAGDGAVTAKMAPFFKNVYATEMSSTMKWRLQQKGYKLLDVYSWDKQIASLDSKNDDNYLKYDVISCLNLLDRCDTPYTLLKQIKNALKKDGLLIVALVLPFKPYVEYNKDNNPQENLLELDECNEIIITRDNSTENSCSVKKSNKLKKLIDQINYFIKNVFKPIGFELTKFTKLPYLCEGNLAQSYYFMLDYVFVFKSKD